MVKRLAIATLALAAAGLSACGGRGPDPVTTAPCPRIGILGDAADLTRYAGNSQDLTAMQLDARITGFNAKCDFGSGKQGLDVTLSVNLRGERGPAAQARTAALRYLVAVVDPETDKILARQTYTATLTFDPNVPRQDVRTDEITIHIGGIPPEAAKKSILVGFQLTPEELALNRRRGPR